jgi:hypothetical protein
MDRDCPALWPLKRPVCKSRIARVLDAADDIVFIVSVKHVLDIELLDRL